VTPAEVRWVPHGPHGALRAEVGSARGWLQPGPRGWIAWVEHGSGGYVVTTHADKEHAMTWASGELTGGSR